MNLSTRWAVLIQSILAVVLILLVAWIIDFLITFLMRKLASQTIGIAKNKWYDILLKNKVFAKAAHILPGVVLMSLYHLIASPHVRNFIENIIDSYFLIVVVLLINGILNSFYDWYGRKRGEYTNIKIYIQLLKVIVFSFGALIIISIFANKNFMDILKGLGAMVTILLIVYKDTIMGFVAGIQLSANEMVKVGDWVSFPKDNADGTVIDISLTTVKVQNWDKTITTIPTYKLISESFTNWKGMEESEGRRIKRHINIDMDTIYFLSPADIEKFRKFKLLKEYIESVSKDIAKTNEGEPDYVNQRRLTNIGTFRIYVENYLKSTGYVNTDMTFIVRQLQSTEMGLPIEIYMFSKEKKWRKYEEIQSNIFDHIFAILPEFNLMIFQNPSARSFRQCFTSED